MGEAVSIRSRYWGEREHHCEGLVTPERGRGCIVRQAEMENALKAVCRNRDPLTVHHQAPSHNHSAFASGYGADDTRAMPPTGTERHHPSLSPEGGRSLASPAVSCRYVFTTETSTPNLLSTQHQAPSQSLLTDMVEWTQAPGPCTLLTPCQGRKSTKGTDGASESTSCRIRTLSTQTPKAVCVPLGDQVLIL